MIDLYEGTEEHGPYVHVEIYPGRRWFEWWYEVSVWNAEEQVWYHNWEKDSGAFFFWFAFRKAKSTLHEVWFEEAKKERAVRITPSTEA